MLFKYLYQFISIYIDTIESNVLDINHFSYLIIKYKYDIFCLLVSIDVSESITITVSNIF